MHPYPVLISRPTWCCKSYFVKPLLRGQVTIKNLLEKIFRIGVFSYGMTYINKMRESNPKSNVIVDLPLDLESRKLKK